jgi:hypothetical protein
VNDLAQALAQQIGSQWQVVGLYLRAMHLQQWQPGGVDEFLPASAVHATGPDAMPCDSAWKAWLS